MKANEISARRSLRAAYREYVPARRQKLSFVRTLVGLDAPGLCGAFSRPTNQVLRTVAHEPKEIFA